MITENKFNYIKAMGRLYEFCSSLKFHLIKKDFIEDEIGKLAIEINDKIKAENGINLFEAREENDLIKYEKFLNTYNFNFTSKYFNYNEIGDDYELLKNSKPFPKDNFTQYNIGVNDRWKEILATKYKITYPSFKAYIKTPHSLEIFDNNESNNKLIFTTAKIKLNHKDKILLTVLDNRLDTRTNKSVRGGVLYSGSGSSPMNWSLQLAVIIDFNKYSTYLNSPVNLFIQVVRLYGVTKALGTKQRKLFVNDYIDSAVLKSGEDYFNKTADGRLLVSFIMFYKGIIGDKVLIAYWIDLDSLFADYLKGAI